MLVFIMLVIVFYSIQMVTKGGKPVGKDCLPGVGGIEIYWFIGIGFFQCGFTSPRQFQGYFFSFFFFFWRFILASWYHTLCLLVVPTGITHGPSSGRWHFGKDWERWSWFVQRDSNNNSIKSWIKHIHPVLCLDPKDLLTHFSHKSGCQDVSQMGWL